MHEDRFRREGDERPAPDMDALLSDEGEDLASGLAGLTIEEAGGPVGHPPQLPAAEAPADPFLVYGPRILTALRRIIHAVDRHSSKLASLHHVTGPQLICLAALVQNGPLPLTVLARTVSLSASTVNGIVDRLLAKELVTRVRDERDRRKVLITATGKGIAMVADAPLPLPDRFARALRSIPDLEQAAIALSLEKIVELMGFERAADVAATDGGLPAPSEE